MPFVSHLERFGERRGLEKGRQEGRSEGRREGRASQLLRQLQLKFSTLPADLPQRVMNADEAQLDLWAERILFATRLEEVVEG